MLNKYHNYLLLLTLFIFVTLYAVIAVQAEAENGTVNKQIIFDLPLSLLKKRNLTMKNNSSGSAGNGVTLTSKGVQVAIPIEFDRHSQSEGGSRAGYVSSRSPERGCNTVLECNAKEFLPSCFEQDKDSENCSVDKLKTMLNCLDKLPCQYLKRRFCENDAIISIDSWEMACEKWGLDEAAMIYKDKHNIPYEVEQEDQGWLMITTMQPPQ